MPVPFTDNPSVAARRDRYFTSTVDGPATVKAWRKSLYSFEWLNPDGFLKAVDDLGLAERDKRLRVETRVKDGLPLDRPVLGIGLLDNVEIGAGRDVLLTLVALGYDRIEVHVPLSAKDDLLSLLRD